MTKPLYNRINQYRILWVFVFFDLPVDTKTDRRHYTRFRKHLLKDGFAMLQQSIYIRHSNSKENARVHIQRTKSVLPPKGNIIIFTITDRQFGDMQFFQGSRVAPRPETPQQLVLFE